MEPASIAGIETRAPADGRPEDGRPAARSLPPTAKDIFFANRASGIDKPAIFCYP